MPPHAPSPEMPDRGRQRQPQPGPGAALAAVDRVLHRDLMAMEQGKSPRARLLCILADARERLGAARVCVRAGDTSIAESGPTVAENREEGTSFALALGAEARLWVIPESGAAGMSVEVRAAWRIVAQRVALVLSAHREADALGTAQRFEALGRVVSGVAHDFNNALTAILGYVQLLGQDVPRDAPSRNLAAQAVESIGFAAGLTQQLLDFCRGGGEAELISLNDAVSRYDHLLRSLLGDRRRLVLALGSEAPRVRAVPTAIGQLLLNLVSNARDALPDGGNVEIGTANDFLSGRRCAVLRVTDDGCGIPNDLQSRIFDPLFTTKPRGQGTGLGLATVRSIVAELGGRIALESTPGTGTTFAIHLPAAE